MAKTPHPSGAPGPREGSDSAAATNRPVWPWVVGATVLVLLLCFAGSAIVLKGLANDLNKAAETEHVVIYEVTGDSTAHSITYVASDSGGTEQVTEAKLPWRKKTTSKGLWNLYHVVARNGADGKIRCRIMIDGVVVTEKTSQGGYALVTCRATSDDVKK